MKIRAVLTDLDGTLVDSIPLIMESDNAAIKKFGFKVTHQRLRELSQLHSREIAYYLMDSNRTSFDLFAFVDYRRNYFVRLLKKHKPKNLWFKDSKEFLSQVSRIFPLAVVTGSRHRFVNAIFDKKTRSFVDFFITSDDVEHKKPDVEPLLRAIKLLGVDKSEVVFIGDSEQDGLMCQRAGVKFVAKIGGISTENSLRKYKPVFVAKSFSEVLRFLNLFS
jgi:phosphoglycolate phosphatase-like HAD superfamily hydrolase